MIHVVDFEKTAFSTPFRGILAPSGLQIIAESGMGYPLPGTRETWLAPNVHLLLRKSPPGQASASAYTPRRPRWGNLAGLETMPCEPCYAASVWGVKHTW